MGRLEDLVKRPEPPKELILAVTGRNDNLIRAAHHGLFETTLREFYPHLNLEELLAFAAGSWKMRRRYPETFAEFVSNHNIYKIFTKVYQDSKYGMNQFSRHRKRAKKHELYEIFNPFKKKDLSARLESVNQDDVEILKEQLQRNVCRYLCNPPKSGNIEDGAVVIFPYDCPDKNTRVIRYADKITKIISGYAKQNNHFTVF